MDFVITQHGLIRARQRNLSLAEVEYVLNYGQVFHQGGAQITFLRRHDVPPWDRSDPKLMRLVGTAVVSTTDGQTIITVWRNARTGLKRIRRKPKYTVENRTRRELPCSPWPNGF